MNDEQRRNLEKLAAYLERYAAETGHSVRFEMGQFCDVNHYYDSIQCGTIGCAVGHGPEAGVEKWMDEWWYEYVERAFTGGDDDVYCWLFDDGWKYNDNTPLGAAKRIRWYLRHGVPDDYLEQMEGESPLCYDGGTF